MRTPKMQKTKDEQYLQRMINGLADKKLVTIATELDDRIKTLENAPHNAKLATMVSLLIANINKVEIRLEMMENSTRLK